MEQPTPTTWDDKFEEAVSKLPSEAQLPLLERARQVLEAAIRRGEDAKRLEQIGRRIVQTISRGKMPKNTMMRTQAPAPAPAQQVLATDPIDQLRHEAAALRMELSSVQTKRQRLAYLDRILAAADETVCPFEPPGG